MIDATVYWEWKAFVIMSMSLLSLAWSTWKLKIYCKYTNVTHGLNISNILNSHICNIPLTISYLYLARVFFWSGRKVLSMSLFYYHRLSDFWPPPKKNIEYWFLRFILRNLVFVFSKRICFLVLLEKEYIEKEVDAIKTNLWVWPCLKTITRIVRVWM